MANDTYKKYKPATRRFLKRVATAMLPKLRESNCIPPNHDLSILIINRLEDGDYGEIFVGVATAINETATKEN